VRRVPRLNTRTASRLRYRPITHLKKLWRGIYERIEDRMPEFFGTEASTDEGRRGPEKRRQVLAYVRQRPEELRPWHAS
jgi:hypothetical protein